jgi:hypothetical protein
LNEERAYSTLRVEDDLAMEPADVGIVETDLNTKERERRRKPVDE